MYNNRHVTILPYKHQRGQILRPGGMLLLIEISCFFFIFFNQIMIVTKHISKHTCGAIQNNVNNLHDLIYDVE